MSGFQPIALEGTAVDPFALPLKYQGLLNAPVQRAYTEAQTAETQARVPYTQAQTVGQQIQNQLGTLMLGFRQRSLATAGAALSGQGNAPEPLPGGVSDSAYTTQGAPSGEGVAIGMRQANPLNMENAGQSGALPPSGRFAAFPNMQTGLMATADQLSTYQTAHNVNTVRGAVTRWVGDPKANLTGIDPTTNHPYANTAGQPTADGSYIGDVARRLGVKPDDPINLSDPRVQAAYIAAAQPHESAGGGAVLADADIAAATQAAAARRAGGAGAPYQVAGPWQPPPGGGGGEAGPAQPNALAQTNPMGTSRQGVVMPGLGVPLPSQQVQLAYLSPDPAKALNEAMQNRRSTLAQLAGMATDAQSWNQNVAQAWRMGYLTNGDFQQLYGHFSPQLRDTVVRSMGSPESQTGYAQTLIGHGLVQGPQGPQVDPSLLAGGPPIKVTESLPDGSSREVTYSALNYFRKYGGVPSGYSPTGTGVFDGGTVTPPPPQGQGGQGQGGGQGVSVLGSDGNRYHVPVTPGGNQPFGAPAQPAPGAAQAPPAVPGAGGGATPPPPPGPAAGGAATPAAAAAAPPPVGSPTTTPGAAAPPPPPPPGAMGAGVPQLTPQAQAELAAQQAARTKQLEIPAAVQQAEQTKIAEAYGTQAGQVVANGQAAPVTLERLGALENAASLFRAGASGPQRAQLLKGLQDALQTAGFGVPDWLNDQTTGADVINKLGSFLAANMVKSMGEKAASVFESVKAIQPGVAQSTGGYQAVLNSVRMDATRDRDLLSFQEHWLAPTAEGGLGHASIAGMQDAFNQAHPIEVYASRVLPYPMPASQADAKENVIYRLPNNTIAVWINGHFLPAKAGAAQSTRP